MIYPIVAYGDPILRAKASPVDVNYPNLEQLIVNMFETMHHALGVGLAAPQIGESIQLFVVDTTPFADKDNNTKPLKKAFINPQIIDEYGDIWRYNEGCLSIPDIHEDISRHAIIDIKYLDTAWKPQSMTLRGMEARVVQHEYDHLNGILFIDKVSSLKRKLIRSKLNKISKGITDTDYELRYYKSK